MKSIMSRPSGVKQINRHRAFEILSKERLVSRPQLARLTGLSRAGISILAEDLLRLKLVREVGLGSSGGGRPPVLLEFNPDAAYTIGASIHDSQWSIVVTNLDAQVVADEIVSFEGNSPEAVVAALRRGVEIIRGRFDDSRLLPGIGLGLPGLVDIRNGVIKCAFDFGWNDLPFTQMVKEATGLTAIAANRSKVGALAELRRSASRGIQNLIYVTIGTGVAAGIIYHGVLYVGTNSSAGEFGHMTILPDGPICGCGNHGCLQQLVSEEAIANAARLRLRRGAKGDLAEIAGLHPERLQAVDVLRAAERGDEVSQAVVAEIASYLAVGVGNIINLFNPELIVLGGPVVRESPLLVEMIRREVALRALAYPLSVVEIVQSSLGIDAGAIGAAVLVLQQAASLLFNGSFRADG
jgi:predicted NBD/HSP70 family sugar kinase